MHRMEERNRRIDRKSGRSGVRISVDYLLEVMCVCEEINVLESHGVFVL